ncbi:MAG TPA: NTP transferase domain-containing protein [Polyangiaceae bacterium]|nr:NTP transferase domain-containing protein [Polyangiaceae bacterium]
MSAVAGIFVGGRGERMGGAAKGLLVGPDGRPIIENLRDTLKGLGLEVVLVGKDPRYEPLGLPVVEDEPGGIGPLGGLIGLLRHAGDRVVVAIACDMPFVQAPLVEKLLAAPPASAVAPRRGTRWEPLFARYAPERVLSVARERASRGERSLQGLLDAVGAREMALSQDEWHQLRDWDTPSDVG